MSHSSLLDSSESIFELAGSETGTLDESDCEVAMVHRSNLRLLVLVTILGLLSYAAWYDYNVARLGVNQAYESVGYLNRSVNSSPGSPAMTSSDIQRLIGFAPTYTLNQGEYQVEVYGWQAGLPFRRHAYYAVYTGQGNHLTFVRHYKFVMPSEELRPRMLIPQLATVRRATYTPGPDPLEATQTSSTDP